MGTYMLRMNTQPFDVQPEVLINSEKTNRALFLSAMTRNTIAQIRPLEILKKAPKICNAGRYFGSRLDSTGAMRKPVYMSHVM